MPKIRCSAVVGAGVINVVGPCPIRNAQCQHPEQHRPKLPSSVCATFGCSLPASGEKCLELVFVYPRIIANFNADQFAGCQPLQVKFTNTTNIFNSPGNKYSWDFGDGNSSSDPQPSHLFTNPSQKDNTFDVTLQVTSGNLCTDEVTKKVSAYAYIKADFSIPNSIICSDNKVSILNNSPPGVKHNYWNFGDKPSANYVEINSNPVVHLYSNLDTVPVYYKISQIVKNTHASCADTMADSVYVYPRIVADFDANQFSGCQPLQVNFINKTKILNTPGNTYNWDFGDGNSSSDPQPSHLFTNFSPANSPYDVTLHVSTGNLCTDEVTKTVTAYPFIKADFKVENSNLCSGDSAIIKDVSPPGATKRYWDFYGNNIIDSTITEGNFKHLYTNTGSAS